MRLSYIIVTHNRREPLLRTLAHLHETTPLPREEWEAWVVDNASTDGTAEAVRFQFPNVNYLQRETNEGVWARSAAFEPARGHYLILLDDDSYPIGDAVTRSLAYLDRTPRCAAVVGKVLLPDGTEEGAAFPTVMLSGAVCIRRSILLPRSRTGGGGVGGFRREFFRKAGEYDLSYRIWDAGYSVERFDDIVYRHDKVMTGRSKPFAHRMDLRNNLILVERYLPDHLRSVYRRDVAQRYTALARHEGCVRAAWLARLEAFAWRVRECVMGRQTLQAETVEILYQLEHQTDAVEHFVRQHKPSRVVIADLSKNVYATFQAARRNGLNVLAIADDHPAYRGLSYRSVPVLPLTEALATGPDAVILSNINPAQVPAKMTKLRAATTLPILRLWRPQYSVPTPLADAA